jgi:hypothetical protein
MHFLDVHVNYSMISHTYKYTYSENDPTLKANNQDYIFYKNLENSCRYQCRVDF